MIFELLRMSYWFCILLQYWICIKIRFIRKKQRIYETEQGSAIKLKVRKYVNIHCILLVLQVLAERLWMYFGRKNRDRVDHGLEKYICKSASFSSYRNWHCVAVSFFLFGNLDLVFKFRFFSVGNWHATFNVAQPITHVA